MAERSSRPKRGAPRLGAGPMPDGVVTTVLTMASADGARVPGVLYQVPRSGIVAVIMHPRLDMSRHYLTSRLAAAGVSVLAVGTRSVGNDLALVHEQALLDAAAGFRRARELGFDHVVAVGASGGAALFAFYAHQAALPADERLAATPAGDPIDLADLDAPDALVFVAPHPGQGELLLGCIDPAVADEGNPRLTVRDLDLFDPVNGFVPPYDSSKYGSDFLASYRRAQRDRVARIDARALAMVAERHAAEERYATDRGDLDRRLGNLGEVITVYRTDADPRTVDLSIDPSDRPYGSVHGSRPDLGNVGVAGFGRLATPEAWLSTWSGHHSNARFLTCAPGVRAPTLFVEYTGDQANFPTPSAEMFDALAATDKTRERVRGTHFGGSILAGEPPGGELAARLVTGWLSDRFGTT